MNISVSTNYTSVYQCLDFYPGSNILQAAGYSDFFFIPLHCWILWLGSRGMKAGGSIAPSDILTMNLAVAELVSCFSFFLLICSAVFNSHYIMYFGLFFGGSHLVGRPLLNSLICVERYVAVVYPVYHRHSSSRQRYVVVGMVWLVILSFGGLSINIYPKFPSVLFTSLLMVDVLMITSCSLLMLRALVRPGPGERENKEMQHKKKRVFIIITTILVALIIAYGPFLVVFIMKDELSINTFCFIVAISLWIFKPSCVIQPLLYLFKLRKLPCIKAA